MLLSFLSVAFAGIVCPAGMVPLDVEFAVDRASLVPFNLDKTTNVTFQPEGFIFLNVAALRKSTDRTPIDPGGQYRGCLVIGGNGEVGITLVADLVQPAGYVDRLPLWTLLLTPGSGAITLMIETERRLEKMVWDKTTPFVIHPFPGMTVTISDAS